MKRVGIFSGTFDPVHDGHITFAREALERYSLDKIFFLIEPRPRRKQGVKAFTHRVSMVRLAIKHEPKLGLIVLKQARFTAEETLPVLQARFKGAGLYMLMGEDMLNHLADWPHVDQLIAAVHFIIGVRHKTTESIAKLVHNLEQTRGIKLHYDIFMAGDAGISSSQVRLGLRHDREVKGLHPSVRSYIKRHNLYSISGE